MMIMSLAVIVAIINKSKGSQVYSYLFWVPFKLGASIVFI